MTEETKAIVYKLVPASPKALKKCQADLINTGERGTGNYNTKYPFAEMLIGEAFTVPFAECEPNTVQQIRSASCAASKKLDKKFLVLLHDEYKCVEVARIA